MLIKRNNKVKEFAIDNKFDIMGKVCEVAEEIFCGNYFITNIYANVEFTNIKHLITFYLENKDIICLVNTQIALELMVHLLYLKNFLKMILNMNMNIIRFHLYRYIK